VANASSPRPVYPCYSRVKHQRQRRSHLVSLRKNV